MSVSTIMGVPVANIAKINGIPIANVASWNGQSISVGTGSDFITEWVIPADSLSVTLPLSSENGSTFNCTVYWGDGQSSTITSYDDADRIHTYANAGTYQIAIRGTCEGWSTDFAYTDVLKIKRIIQWGNGSRFTGFKYLSFGDCTNLTTTGDSSIKPSGNCQAVAMFRRCTNLTYVSANTFKYLTNLTNASGFFYNCSNLSIAPNGLFRDCKNITNFQTAFANCTKLQIQPWVFYNDGEQSTRFLNISVNFTSCFSRTSFTGTQGTAPDLWNCNFGTGTPTKTGCFSGSGNSATSLSNYASIPSDWK